MSWLDGWTYRKSVTLSRASGAVTNYQMKLLLGQSSGASGENVDAGNLCKSDFSDIRFTTSDGTTLLDYWIESVAGTDPNRLATIWIEFDSIDTSATTFYMYYGNSAASAVSNGANTFPLFDDFSGDLSLWDTSGTVAITSGICHVSAGQLAAKATFGIGYAVRSLGKTDATGSLSNVLRWDGSGSYTRILNYVDFSTTYETCDTISGFTVTNVTQSTNWLVREIQRITTSSVKYLYGDVLKATRTDNTTNANIAGVWSSTKDISVDWILVRPILATEPVWGAWGATTTFANIPLISLTPVLYIEPGIFNILALSVEPQTNNPSIFCGVSVDATTISLDCFAPYYGVAIAIPSLTTTPQAFNPAGYRPPVMSDTAYSFTMTPYNPKFIRTQT